MEILIVNYGLGNTQSIINAFKHCGARVEISDDPERIERARALILPGVGAFGDGMARLNEQKLDSAILSAAEADVPILGICLGMQLLMESSVEFGSHKGLGLIEGSVQYFHSFASFDKTAKTPNIGWCEIEPIGDAALLRNLTYDMYFVHSLCVTTNDPSHTLAFTSYGNVRFSSVIARKNIFGCQFHPEKSGPGGLQLIENFLTSLY